MARLYVLSGPDLGRTHELRPGDLAGRGQDCALVLRHPSVSRRHARFEREDAPEGERWSVADAGSTNGLFVDGERVERALLEDGAVFRLGELELRFRLAPERESTAAPAPPARRDEPAAHDEIELELPEEIELEPAPAARPGPSPFTTFRHSGAPPAPGSRTLATQPGAPSLAAAPLPSHAFPAARAGLFSSDLSQQPASVRFFAAVLVLLLCAALGFGAWRATLLLRERVASPPPVEEADEG